MLKIGNTYIPFHAINQIVVEEKQAYIWTGDDVGAEFTISIPEDLERLKAWLAEKPFLTLGTQ